MKYDLSPKETAEDVLENETKGKSPCRSEFMSTFMALVNLVDVISTILDISIGLVSSDFFFLLWFETDR